MSGKSVFTSNDGVYEVPPEWELKFARAEVEDHRNGATFLGVSTPSWRVRRAIEEAFLEEINAGRISKVEVS